MRKLYTILLLCGVMLSGACFGQYRILGTWDSICTCPNYFTHETLPVGLIDCMNASLPEGFSVPCYNHHYLDTSVPSALHVVKDCDSLWVVYAGQGDWYENVLGYYTFPWGTHPTSIPDDSITIIFPNATLYGSGGGMERGFRVNIGHVSANTGIGFFFIANGFSRDSFTNGHHGITAGVGKYYSHSYLNQDMACVGTDSSLKRHFVALYNVDHNLIIWGLEDRNRGGCATTTDNDFNDVEFYCHADKDSAFDITGFPLMTCPGDSVGTGSGGGLESQNLGGKVGKRDYEKLKNGVTQNIDYSPAKLFQANMLSNERTTSGYSATLARFMPTTLDSTSTVPYLTTPTDIVDITSAKDVLAVDFVAKNQAKGVALAIETLGKPYNHTKSICDRFRGATLLKTDTMSIQGFKFIQFAVAQPDGNTEYCISFDAGKSAGRNSYNLQSKWLISQYIHDDSVFSFQVWTTIPANCIKLVNQILGHLKAEMPVYQVDTNFSLPSTYIANGKRNKNALNVTLSNYTGKTNGMLMFEEYKNERSENPDDSIWVPVTLAPDGTISKSIVINDGYQYEGHLYIDNVLVDDVYLADGNWGLDYDHSQTTVTQYVPGNDNGRVYADNEFPCYRTIAVRASSSDYINAYKFLASGDEPVDLSSYHSLKFYAEGNAPVTLRLLKKGISKYSSQYKISLNLVPGGTDYAISLDDFYSDYYSGDFKANDVVSLEFDFDFNGSHTDLKFFASGLAFSRDVVYSSRLSTLKTVTIVPNPNSGNFLCRFHSDLNRQLDLVICDATGRVVYSQSVSAVAGLNEVGVNLPLEATNASLMFIKLGNKDVKYNPVKMTFGK